MTTIGILIIAILAAATVVTFIAVITATVLVTGAVHTEERGMTLAGPAPGRSTRRARALLGLRDGLRRDEPAHASPEQVLAWFERSVELSRQ
jgi:hypothetical protein